MPEAPDALRLRERIFLLEALVGGDHNTSLAHQIILLQAEVRRLDDRISGVLALLFQRITHHERVLRTILRHIRIAQRRVGLVPIETFEEFHQPQEDVS